MHAATTDALARALGSIVRDVEAGFRRQLDVFRAERDAVVAELRADLAEARQQRDALVIELRDAVSARLAEVKDGRDGADGRDGKDGEQGPEGEQGPAGADGRDGADGKEGAPGRDGTDGADGKDGASVALDDVLPALQAQVADYLATIPMPKDGKDGVDGKDGEPGPAGRSMVMRGTFDPDAEYGELDVVILGGSSFMAVRDAPGECPGGGWQLMASRGSRGERGERGMPGRDGLPGKDGQRGERGQAGEGIAAFYKDGHDLVITTDGGREHRLGVQK